MSDYQHYHSPEVIGNLETEKEIERFLELRRVMPRSQRLSHQGAYEQVIKERA